MAYLASQLITDAFHLSGIVSRDFQPVSGAQQIDGLKLLNAVIATKGFNSRLIPYYEEFNFILATGVETYFIPNLIEPETFTFNIGPVRYSSSYIPRKQFQGAGRVDDINSLPFNWNFERSLGGGQIRVYFKPQDNYPAIVWGQFALSSVTLFQDLSLTMDLFLIEYLRYALAELICNDYNQTMSQQAIQKLKEYEAELANVSPPDLSLQKVSTMMGVPALNWGDVNIGRGWRP